METIIFAKTIKGYRKRNGGIDMKAYTDLSQGKKLAEILPIETADMRYVPFGDTHPWVWDEEVKLLEKDSVPCWSLAALLDILPNENMLVKTTDGEYYYLDKDVMTKHYDNPVDVCYEIILQLKEKD